MLAESVRPISPAHPPPLDVFVPPSEAGYRLETLLDHRAASLRIPEILDVFRVQAEILRAVLACTSSPLSKYRAGRLSSSGPPGGVPSPMLIT